MAEETTEGIFKIVQIAGIEAKAYLNSKSGYIDAAIDLILENNDDNMNNILSDSAKNRIAKSFSLSVKLKSLYDVGFIDWLENVYLSPPTRASRGVNEVPTWELEYFKNQQQDDIDEAFRFVQIAKSKFSGQPRHPMDDAWIVFKLLIRLGFEKWAGKYVSYKAREEKGMGLAFKLGEYAEEKNKDNEKGGMMKRFTSIIRRRSSLSM